MKLLNNVVFTLLMVLVCAWLGLIVIANQTPSSVIGLIIISVGLGGFFIGANITRRKIW